MDRRQKAARVAKAYSVEVGSIAVCPGHSAPIDFFSSWLYDRPELSLVLGPRGGGKSHLSALMTHIESQVYEYHGTRILGGSLSQSGQIYNALQDFDRVRPGAFATFNKTSATYTTGSDVSMLAASATSVRGPHVATVRLDEVDEIDESIREAAVGMCMERNGISASITMTSTWHNLNGPMAGLVKRGQAGEFPFHTFCVFEVLEHCPEERSGPNLEHCPACPLFKWCHEPTEDGVPKAKKSRGHYAIASLIQKVKAVSLRVFESDYLCRGPKAEGVWFPTFTETTHRGLDAEFNPAFPVYLAIDCGTSRYTAAVFFQLIERSDGTWLCKVFAEYLGIDTISELNARAILEVARQRCHGRIDRVRLDPASKQRTSVGPIVYGEYERVFDSRRIAPWPLKTIRESIELLDSFIRPAVGPVSLRVHPRCVGVIDALKAFRRLKRSGAYIDEPEREQHPVEDFVDALKGGLCDIFPEGRRPQPGLQRVAARSVF